MALKCVYIIHMIRKNVWFDKEQLDFISKLPGPESDHIRRALDDYIQKIKRQQIKGVSTSPSAEGVDLNG